MVALFNHCTFNLNPRATSIDTPLHGFVPHTHVDHVHADAVIAIAASENAEALTQEVFGGELGFLPWQRPGFDLGLKLGAMAEANPKLKGVVLGGHGLFTWGPTSKACYETTIDMINKASAWLAARRAERGLRRRSRAGLAARAKARGRRAAHAGDPQAHLGGRAQDRPFHRRAGGARIRQFARAEAARGARHLLPGSFPAHENPAAGAAVRSGGDEPRRGRRLARRQPRRLSRRLRGLLRALQAAELAGDARSQRRSSISFRASACSPSPRTRRRRGSRRSSTSTRSTSCAAPRASAAMSGSPSRRRSTSNTGCSRRRSCSACRSRSRSPGASPSSPAAPAASGGRSPSA